MDSYKRRVTPFHGGNTGSIPVGRASEINGLGKIAGRHIELLSNKWDATPTDTWTLYQTRSSEGLCVMAMKHNCPPRRGSMRRRAS
jgi:hypothetical protein